MSNGPGLIQSFGDFLKKMGKKEATIESYCRDISQFMKFLESENSSLSKVDIRTLGHYRNALQEKNRGGKSNSFRRAVIAIRQFYRHLPQFSSFPLGSLDELPIPVREEQVPRNLRKEQIDSLLNGAQSGSRIKDARDKAIVALLCFEGIKVSELISLEWKHFLSHQDQSSLLIPGERTRSLILNAKTHELLVNYQKISTEQKDMLPKHHRMFLGFKGPEAALVSSKISRHGLKFMLYELGETNNIHGLNTEILRHHAIQHQLDSGSSPEEVMKHLGLRRIGNIAKHHRVKKL